MEERIVKYSVLRYVPSKIGGEVMNLGVLLCDENSENVRFMCIKKYARLSSFDDELDVADVKELLNSIRNEVDSLSSQGLFEIEQFTRFYKNTFSFDKPKMTSSENFEETCSLIEGLYLKYDKPKKDRPSAAEERKFLEGILKTKKINLKKNVAMVGSCDENIKYDFETEKAYIKMFDYDGKDLSKNISTAKSWAWNGMNSPKKLVIVYRYSGEDKPSDKNLEIILNVFKTSGVDVCDVTDVSKLMKMIA